MNYHCNDSFNAVVREALGKVEVALVMAIDNREHAIAHEAHGLAAQDQKTIDRLTRAAHALNKSLRS